jgi:putative MATE family efflux protein
MAVPIAAGMIFQTLYFLVDLYFIGTLGDAAIAGVGAAGNVVYIVMALTQALGVGSVALIAKSVGQKDRPHANLVFNQSLLLAAICMAGCLLAGYTLAPRFVYAQAADAATRAFGIAYLHTFVPAMALQFVMVALGSALRGTGIVKPMMVVQVLTVLINIVLAPVLISGWGTGRSFGAAGAGMASTLSVSIGVLALWAYFHRLEHYVGFRRVLLVPRPLVWRQILAIGIPAGGEFLILFVTMAFNYWVLQSFGPETQAGFGVGQRIFQALFLPAMAVAFSVAPIAGQNHGGRHPVRVRATFTTALRINLGVMLLLLLLCQMLAATLVRVFTHDTVAVAVGVEYLRYVTWVLLPAAVSSVCTGLLQGVGNTWPTLWCSASRIASFVLPMLWLATLPGFSTRVVWWMNMLSSLVNMLLIAWVTARWFRRQPAGPA